MNPAIYAKALTGGGAAGSLSIIINWLVGLLAGWLGSIGAPMPSDVQGAFTALIVALVTGLVVYHTANAPADPPPVAQGSAQTGETAPRA